MDVGAMVSDFISQSERVLNVTHKPKGEEYEHIAKSTALGMAVIGIIGYAISILWHFLRQA
jgi:protein transport protein SEC61 subunit gamma and related proteins